MAENSGIQWTDHTNNLWEGCTEVHRGCDNCYAAALSKRWGKDLWGKDRPRRYVKKGWTMFEKWNREAREADTYALVFVGSMMDIFERSMPVVDNNGDPLYRMPNGEVLDRQVHTDDLRMYFFNEIVPKYPNLMFLLLTKRPSNIYKMVPLKWFETPPRNVFFGASIVDQKSLMTVTRHLARTVYPNNFNTFWSVEPLLEDLDMHELDVVDWPDYMLGYRPKWVIVGGESGAKYRRFEADWARNIRQWCDGEGIAFFMKQMNGKKQPIPVDLQIREFPNEFDRVYDSKFEL